MVEEEENEYYNNRIEYYSGLTVFLMKYNEFEEFYRPIRFIVTESGMPTVHGVEVGDTMERFYRSILSLICGGRQMEIKGFLFIQRGNIQDEEITYCCIWMRMECWKG